MILIQQGLEPSYVDTHLHICGHSFTYMWTLIYIYVDTHLHICGQKYI
ncbi:hypothetical protein ENHYDAX1_50002 [Enhydrobacter sp. AX1]|nr:hypothetical protein ENHYDAX1_50002 [Enhydrobacter sp. AX1]